MAARCRFLCLLVVAACLAGVVRAGAASLVRWVVLDGPAAGSQLLADPRRPYSIQPALNSGAGGEVLQEGLFREAGGTVAPVALYQQLPAWQRHLSDALLALSAGRRDLAQGHIDAALDAAAGMGLAAPESLSHSLPRLRYRARSAASEELPSEIRTAFLREPLDDPNTLNGLVISAFSLGFDQVCVGDTKSQSFTISNPAGSPARTISGAIPAPFTVAGLPATLQGGQTVTVTVTFTPTAQDHYFESLKLSSGDETGSVSPVAGDGRDTFTLIDPTVNFGKLFVDDSKKLTFKVHNCTSKELKLKVNPPDDHHFKLEVPYPTTVAAHEDATVTVEFSPDKVGDFFARMKISASIPGVKKSKRDDTELLFGKGIGALDTDKKAMIFGTVPRNEFKSLTLTLTNNTTQAQNATLDTSGLGTVFTSSQTGAVTVQPGQPLTIQITFGATGKCKHKDKLVINVTGPPSEQIVVYLTAASE